MGRELDEEGIFEAVVGARPGAIVDTLLAAKLDVGFEAQEFGCGQASVASSGAVVSALASLQSFKDESLRPLVTEIAQWVDAHGQIRPVGIRPRADSTWADSQCLRALCQRPHLLDDGRAPVRLAIRLAAARAEGGWPLRPGLPPNASVLVSVYPVLALIAARRVGFTDRVVNNVLQAEADRLRDTALSPARAAIDRLMAAALVKRLDRAGYGHLDPAEFQRVTDDLEGLLWQRASLALEEPTVTDRNQPIWYARVFRPALYLFARTIWPAGHPVPTLLADELRRRFDPASQAWGNQEGGPLTWATALGLRTGLAVARDIMRSGIGLETWLARAEQLAPASGFDYDVVISFSGRQRDVAAAINRRLREAGLVTFYDADHQHELLGEELTVALQRIYFSRSRFAIAVLSSEFVASPWAGNWEWKAILAAMQQRSSSYLLPYFLEEVEIPGLNPTIGYVSRTDASPEEFADIVIRKIRTVIPRQSR